MPYICCFCKNEFQDKQKFIAHRRFCKLNPDYQKNLDQIRSAAKLGHDAVKNSHWYDKIDPMVEYTFKCEKCGGEFKKTIRQSKYKRGKIPRFCSEHCAHSNKHSLEERERISNTLKKFCTSEQYKEVYKKRFGKDYNGIIKEKSNKEGVVKKIRQHVFTCVICGKKFYHEKTDIKTCSLECLSILKKQLGKENYQKILKAGKFKGWQSRNILSYPEKFWIKVLKNNGIEYKPNFTVKKSDLGIPNTKNCYFLDFLILDNLDLEIDGSQHQYRKESDATRDELLKKNGYVVYRIDWNEINTTKGKQLMFDKIQKFLNFYENFKNQKGPSK